MHLYAIGLGVIAFIFVSKYKARCSRVVNIALSKTLAVLCPGDTLNSLLAESFYL